MAKVKTTRSAARTFRELARLHVRAQRATVGNHGGFTRCSVVTELGRAGSTSLTDLARRLQVDKGWVSRTIDQMVSDGTVIRESEPSDRRVVSLALSAAGRREHRDLERRLDAQIESIFARLSASDRKAVGAAVQLLYDAYVEATASGDAPDAPRAAGDRRRRTRGAAARGV